MAFIISEFQFFKKFNSSLFRLIPGVLNSIPPAGDDEEALLAKALAMSIGVGDEGEDDSRPAHVTAVNVTAPTSGAFGHPTGEMRGI